MSVLLQPGGRALVRREILAMSPRQVTWFIDPQGLLRHLADLKSVKVAAFCQRCYKLGLEEDVHATFSPDQNAWHCRCACSDYPPLKVRGKRLEFVTTADDGTEKTRRVYAVDDLLLALGWSFKCAGECARLGMHDGIEGDNDPKTNVLQVSCGCTVRTYQEPLAS